MCAKIGEKLNSINLNLIIKHLLFNYNYVKASINIKIFKIISVKAKNRFYLFTSAQLEIEQKFSFE